MFVAKKKTAHTHLKLRRSGMSGETCRPYGTQDDAVISHVLQTYRSSRAKSLSQQYWGLPCRRVGRGYRVAA